MLQQNHFASNQLHSLHLSSHPLKHHHHSLFFTHKNSPANQQFLLDLPSTQNVPHSDLPTQKPKTFTEEQGFALDHQDEPQITFMTKDHLNIHLNPSSSTSKKFVPYRIKQPKIKLTFISKEKQPEHLSLTLKKEYENKSMQIKKNTFHCQSICLNPQKIISNCVIKVKRNFVADNISYHNYNSDQNKKIKLEIISAGHKIVYELTRETSTYAQLDLLRENSSVKKSPESVDGPRKNSMPNKKLSTDQQKGKTNQQKGKQTSVSKLNQTVPQLHKKPNSFFSDKPQQFFLDNPLNQLLKSKLKESFIFHKHREPNKNLNEEIQFDSEFESGNLQFVAKINNEPQKITSQTLNLKQQKDQQISQSKLPEENKVLEYNLYLRNDTNTHGHQNWFYFRVMNHSIDRKRVRFNVVNLKRNLNLVREGQRIYARRINPQKSGWYVAGEKMELRENKFSNVYKCKVRVLSFELQLEAETHYELSLLPPYTYSEMLSDLERLKSNKMVKIQTLTYSLIGLAIPIVTFTNPEVQDAGKQVILVSSRIHPGQTVASFIANGIMDHLSKESPEVEEFLSTTIVKIVPIINPDGVVFGNFRTNYLGYDLNRSFHSEDEITNPEVLALKQLGKSLKITHPDKFHTFIDLHGHSSQKNIFTYGPDYQNGHQNFYKARLLPKLLNSKSPFFNYSACTFKLQEYKSSTARAFFLKLGVTSFTIESSYAIYEPEPGKNQILTSKEWIAFGQTLSDSLSTISRLNKVHPIKNRTTLKRVISLTEDDNFQLLNTLKKQMKKQENTKKTRRIILDKGDEDSDGEDQTEDLNANQREEIEKKLIENTAKNFLLPKVFKPSILYPTVTPKIFNIGETSASNYKILYTRRNRYQSIKMPPSTYLHSLQGMESLKPKARNIKIEQKMVM